MEQKITLDELPLHTPWVARVCHTERFEPKKRDPDQVVREYQVSKWGGVKNYLQNGGRPDFDSLLKAQGMDPDRVIPFLREGEMFLAPASQVMREWSILIVQSLKKAIQEFVSPAALQTLVELGSGLGDKLMTATQELGPREAWGGEFTTSGVDVGTMLAQASGLSNVRFRHFNYLDPSTCLWIPEGAVVYTVHSIEQIPELPVETLRALASRKPKVVIHLEPVFSETPTSTFGTLKKGYALLNDYNQNLLPALRSLEREGVLGLHDVRHDIFGCVPFNATSRLVWTPT